MYSKASGKMSVDNIETLEDFIKKVKEYKERVKELDNLYAEILELGKKTNLPREYIENQLKGIPPLIKFPYTKKHKFLLEALDGKELSTEDLKSILRSKYKVEGKDGVINTMIQDLQDYGLIYHKRDGQEKFYSLTERGQSILKSDISETVRLGEMGEKSKNILEVVDGIEELTKPKKIWEILKEKGIQYPKKEVSTILLYLYQRDRINSIMSGGKRLYSKKSSEK